MTRNMNMCRECLFYKELTKREAVKKEAVESELLEIEMNQYRNLIVGALDLFRAVKAFDRGEVNEDNIIKLFVDPNGPLDVVTEDDIAEEYDDCEFSEVAFLDDEELLIAYDPYDVISVDGVDYLCGPMLVLEMDSDGNIQDINRNTIQTAVDYVEMNLTEIYLQGEAGWGLRMI